MAQQDQGNHDGGREDEEFAWVRLEPVSDGFLFWPPTFKVFQVDVKSNSVTGQRLHTDPLDLFREKIPEMGIDEGARAQVLRVNAERPANPVKRKEVWIVYPDNTTAVGVQYKYME
jgi:hypothetical protein